MMMSSFYHSFIQEPLNENHIVRATVLAGNLMKKNLVK